MTRLRDFNLIFYRRSDAKMFIAKRVTFNRYVLVDPETGEKIAVNRSKLQDEYIPSEANKTQRMKHTKGNGKKSA
jgi:hypothetical protein